MQEIKKPGLLNALVIRLFGDPARVSLEHRVINAMMVLVFLTGVLSTLSNLVIGISSLMILLSVICAIAGIIGYWLSRRMRAWQALIVPVFGFFLALLSAAWISQGGTNGSMGYFFFLVIVFAIVLFKGPGKMLSLVITATVIIALLLIELLAPANIIPYTSAGQRFADVAIAWLICLFITSTMVYVLYNEYQRERRARDKLLTEISGEKENALKSMKEKQRLLSMICHDIANALTAIQNTVALMKIEGNTGRKLNPQYMDNLRFATANIDEIIKSVRMMEAVEQNRISLKLEPVELGPVISNAERLFLERLAERRLKLDILSKERLSLAVFAEPKILSNHVLSNLISNAIKFSHDGSTICICIEDMGGEIAIRVADSGIGIPPEMIPQLFDPFSKTSRQGVNGEPGTGFGMMTVKSFVELFGGRISVESTPETALGSKHGTVVTVYLKKAGKASAAS